MRAVLLAAIVLLVAGCASPGQVDSASVGGADETATPAATPASPGANPSPSPSSPSKSPSNPPDPSAQPADPSRSVRTGTFCEAESGCTFWDDELHEYVLYDVDSAVIDILIVPSASVDTAADTKTIRAAVDAWAAGIQQLGAPWLAEGLILRTYLLGVDTPPQEALDDPEILVLAAEYNPVLLFGIGYQLPSLPCRGAATATYATHEHHGARVIAADCEQGGYTCAALNFDFLTGSQVRLQDLVAHEVGHCLGGGHVGDALDFSAKTVPIDDIMSYQHDPEQVHCVSSLNVRVLEGIYAPLLGATLPTTLAPGDYLTMSPLDYAQVTCANP